MNKLFKIGFASKCEGSFIHTSLWAVPLPHSLLYQAGRLLFQYVMSGEICVWIFLAFCVVMYFFTTCISGNKCMNNKFGAEWKDIVAGQNYRNLHERYNMWHILMRSYWGSLLVDSLKQFVEHFGQASGYGGSHCNL